MQKLALGIDIGGTNVRLGIVTSAGELAYFTRESIDRTSAADDFVEFLVAKALASNLMAEVEGGGLAIAAALSKDGIPVPGLTNFSVLAGYPIGQKLSASLGIPLVIENDAALALHGELHFGAARDCKDALLLTLGTGIGSSLLLNGKIRRGAHGRGSEIGETLIYDVHQETYVRIEDLVSGSALTRRLGNDSLFDRAESGDQRAIDLVNDMCESLGRLIVNVHLLLDIEKVIIGGGLAEAGDALTTGLQSAVDRICPPSLHSGLRVEAGQLPPDATGVIGAACLWYEHNGALPKC